MNILFGVITFFHDYFWRRFLPLVFHQLRGRYKRAGQSYIKLFVLLKTLLPFLSRLCWEDLDPWYLKTMLIRLTESFLQLQLTHRPCPAQCSWTKRNKSEREKNCFFLEIKSNGTIIRSKGIFIRLDDCSKCIICCEANHFFL